MPDEAQTNQNIAIAPCQAFCQAPSAGCLFFCAGNRTVQRSRTRPIEVNKVPTRSVVHSLLVATCPARAVRIYLLRLFSRFDFVAEVRARIYCSSIFGVFA